MIEVPAEVGESEYTTPARISTPPPPPSAPTSSPSSPPPPSPSHRPPPPNPRPTSTSTSTSSPDDPIASLIDPSTPLSFVVRDALDDLLLNVIKQLQHDLNHGPQHTRSKIASQFLPRIMKAIDKDEAKDQTELDELRKEMERLNQEMLTGEPVLYASKGHAPDDEDLPQIDPETGLTVE